MQNKISIVYFGSSQFSKYVLGELERAGLSPVLNITSAKEDLPMDKLRELNADVFVVASFGKILPAELIYMPKHKTLNVHPSLLPKLQGASPIQSAILAEEETGVTIIRMDEKVDHGPILAQEKVSIEPWPDHYAVVEEKLGKVGGRLLAEILPKPSPWTESPQDDSSATFCKRLEKEDGLLNLNDSPEVNLRKVYAYSTWPGAYFLHSRKDGKQIRITVKDAKLENGELKIISVVPEGKKEMNWQD
ncbi:MAG: methionyl-tRNA formyltransferase, partial [bacterium]|nr:methionyl-tRNA formyltransferase [bacterium]